MILTKPPTEWKALHYKMPKKKSPKNSKKQKITEIKKNKKIIESKKESELEENVEEFSEENEFIPSFTPIETSAPVLEKISSQKTNLEESIISQSLETDKKEEKRIDYAQNSPRYGTARENETQEKKYQSDFRAPVLEAARFTDTNREFLMPRRQALTEMSDNREKIETGSFEHEQRLPFEQEQKKYKKVKL